MLSLERDGRLACACAAFQHYHLARLREQWSISLAWSRARALDMGLDSICTRLQHSQGGYTIGCKCPGVLLAMWDLGIPLESSRCGSNARNSYLITRCRSCSVQSISIVSMVHEFLCCQHLVHVLPPPTSSHAAVAACSLLCRGRGSSHCWAGDLATRWTRGGFQQMCVINVVCAGSCRVKSRGMSAVKRCHGL